MIITPYAIFIVIFLRFVTWGCIIMQSCYHSVTLSAVEGSHDILNEMFRLRFAPVNMTE